ncbi:hypothetical protein PT286_04480 [Neisseriaceae bacterium ESL0693]|nr:hypothetical protein [Neisseriaceae bacterium ESL0693]
MLNPYLSECIDIFEKYKFSAFVVYFDEDGKLVLKEIEPGAYLIKTEDIKELIKDQFEVDNNLAFELYRILKTRLDVK